jgi:hypothetical protein
MVHTNIRAPFSGDRLEMYRSRDDDARFISSLRIFAECMKAL